ncbi:MAG: hypothetical protein EOP06_13555 [Proteobacteria bacterium]|nr:MAG: hypothetical protein EOP06_13555 [Pseudomonadota bacterium]
MPSRYLFYVSQLISCAAILLCAAFAIAGTGDDLLRAEISLTQKRIEILQKNLAQVKKADAVGQESAAELNAARYQQDLQLHRKRLRALQIIEDEATSAKKNDDQLIRQVAATANPHSANSVSSASLSQTCQTEQCLRILGIVNRDLANQIGSITNQVATQNIGTPNPVTAQKVRQTKSASLSESSKLYLKNFACQRGLASSVQPVELDAGPLGQCFASIMIESVGNNPSALKISDGTTGRLPHEKNMHAFGPAHERITKQLELSTDYQLTPPELFKSCAKESAGSLREALELCYEVLRYNRLRPDIRRKLVDIRGDRPTGGDNSGDWYHLFAMSYTAVRFGALTKPMYWAAANNWDNAATLLVSKFGQTKGDILEIRNDMIGATTGQTATKTIEDYQSKKAKPNPSAQLCNPEQILKKTK